MIGELFNAVGTGLDQLMNLVPLPGRVTILPVKSYSPVPIPNDVPFVAMFNPDTWQTADRFEFDYCQAAGTTDAVQKFKIVRPQDLSFELLIDGTGASGEKREVSTSIELLKRTIGFRGNDHQPSKLFIIWGQFIFQGRAESMDVTYTLFRPNGTPLRAKINLRFVSDKEAVQSILDLDLMSADLTHERTIHDGQRLDQLCNAIYESPRHLLEVAAANGLTTFRTLRVGSEMLFPPIEK